MRLSARLSSVFGVCCQDATYRPHIQTGDLRPSQQTQPVVNMPGPRLSLNLSLSSPIDLCKHARGWTSCRPCQSTLSNSLSTMQHVAVQASVHRSWTLILWKGRSTARAHNSVKGDSWQQHDVLGVSTVRATNTSTCFFIKDYGCFGPNPD